MQVTEIRGYELGFAPEPAIGNARTFIRRRDFLLLEIVTDQGVSGWGEVFSSPFAASALIQKRLAASVLGQSPLEYGRIWHQLVANLAYDRRGPAMMAISAIDMALHDAAARIQGRSVAAMLGGALRDKVLTYASGPFLAEAADPYGHYPAAVEAALRQGFRAIKPRAGLDPRADGAMARDLRTRFGPELGLMVDINQGYTVGAAIDAGRRMAEADLLWIEEPVQPEDIQGYAAVAAAVPVAISGGEALGSLASFRDFLAARTFSILQPDLTVCGGYTGYLRIAALADAHDLPIMPHAFGTIVNHRAALQAAALTASRRGGGPMPYPFMEYDISNNPLIEMAGRMGLSPDGTMAIPDAPGTGLDLTAERFAPWVTASWRCAV
ncbi:mandelate racemase/muconate lactonizing enzyme family protein [Acetobacteraceae bacterium H6797]|nr:mandelate racemase/muconate lactonizing enzyme family protein [Acetobacteraceae bacterium H6797]